MRKKKSAAILLSELRSYIDNYNPVEKCRDVLVYSTFLQRVPAAKNGKHKTEDNKKNAARKLIDKLEFDKPHMAGEQTNLDGAQEESNFILAEIDSFFEGTLGKMVIVNLPVYEMLMVIRDKRVDDAKPHEKRGSQSHQYALPRL